MDGFKEVAAKINRELQAWSDRSSSDPLHPPMPQSPGAMSLTSIPVRPNFRYFICRPSIKRNTALIPRHDKVAVLESPGGVQVENDRLLPNNEIPRSGPLLGWADPHSAAGRFDQILHINVPEGEFIPAKGEVDAF